MPPHGNFISNRVYTRFNTLSGVTDEPCHLYGLAPGPHFKVAAVAGCWQRVEDLIS